MKAIIKLMTALLIMAVASVAVIALADILSRKCVRYFRIDNNCDL